MASSAGQSPHHGLQDDVYEAEGGSSYRGETPIPSDLEVDFPEPEIQRLVKVTGDPDFCQHRGVLEATVVSLFIFKSREAPKNVKMSLILALIRPFLTKY